MTTGLHAPITTLANPTEPAPAKLFFARMKEVSVAVRHIVMVPKFANMLIQAVRLLATTQTSAPTPIPVPATVDALASTLTVMAMAGALAILFAAVIWVMSVIFAIAARRGLVMTATAAASS